MTNESVQVVISSSNGGIENEVKIRNGQDLQVAIETLQLAARYEFDEDLAVEVDSDSSDTELEELVEKIEQLGEELDGVEQNVGELIEDVSSSVDEKDLEEVRASLDEVEDEVASLEYQSSLVREDPSDEDEEDSESVESDSGESPDFDSMTVPELVDQGLVDVDPPYSYDEFKDLADVEKQVALFEAIPGIQPATKVEVADQIFQEEVTNSNGNRAQYVGYRLNKKMLDFLERRRRPTESGKDPFEFAEEGFDFEEDTGSGSEETEESGERAEEKSSVERNAEAMADAAPEPDVEEEDDSASDVDPEGVEESSTPEDSSSDVEWKSIDVAVGEYKDDHGLKYLINREYQKRYTSPMMAQSFASTNDAEDWAAVEELPEGY